jgi:hypothetical protein
MPPKIAALTLFSAWYAQPRSGRLSCRPETPRAGSPARHTQPELAADQKWLLKLAIPGNDPFSLENFSSKHRTDDLHALIM